MESSKLSLATNDGVLETYNALPYSKITHLRYEDVIKTPLQAAETILKDAGLGFSRETKHAFTTFLEENKKRRLTGGKPKGVYAIEDFEGATEQEVVWDNPGYSLYKKTFAKYL